ncbi:LysR family transcriptional regulator [Pseudoprimorskyibacter insulae]|uniref:HTH-type transcriptional regulator SyrM 1 n=1 Tax=Pseudoprimorskyibacter insulae TaxID=1695997 RepID=A0A2R8AYS0_9RHOB|nr:LysR family transcriptional regulator [Pseudoprimorskyibacter insulae]SPF81158.1 HTH-type transcriptional regulator SyrM 1 [Pseudoprimorskyibacter insulae]
MNFASFDLNLLRILDAVLATGSTTEAANRVGLSQPAVSAALSRLRHALDDPILVRQGRRMVPTDYATALHGPLRRVLDETEAMLTGPAAFDPKTAKATFKISGADFFAELLMPDLADICLREAPGVVLQLVELVPDSYVSSLERYQADMALIPAEPMPDYISEQFLFHSSFVPIARKGHPRLKRLSPGDTIPIDLFCDLGHVLFSPEGKLAAMGDSALAKVGRSRRVVMTLPVFHGVLSTVARSDLIALLPHQLAKAQAAKMGFDIYEAPMPVAPSKLVNIWHSRADNNPAHRWLRDQIARLMAPFDDGPG